MEDAISSMGTVELFMLIEKCARELEDRRTEYMNKVQYFDKLQSQCYHNIETGVFSASTGYKTIMDYQWKLRCRRLAKYDQNIFVAIRDIGDGNFKEWREFIQHIKNFSRLNVLSSHAIENNYNYVNGGQKGVVTYSDMQKEYDNRLGSVDDQLMKLKDRVGNKNKIKKK